MTQPNPQQTFTSIITLIKTAREHIIRTVNTEVIDLYWQVGKEVSEKAKDGGWGKSVVKELSVQITANFGNLRGFSSQNIWRMKQFYETYKDNQILSTLLRELSWSNNRLVMSRAKTDEERLFYIKLAIDENADKDDEVVEYAIQRNISPVLIAEYTAKMPDKKLLQNKLHELKGLTEDSIEKGAT